MAQSLYQMLGVAKTASDDEIRKAYRALARKYHPDVNPDDAVAEDKFKQASAAYTVLADSDKRKAYDEFGEDSLRGGFDAEQARAYSASSANRGRVPNPFSGAGTGGGFDLNDLFGGGWNRGPQKGPDARASVEMTLRQAIVGGEVEFQIPGKGAVKVRIPPGADEGSTIRLKGKGMAGSGGGPRGDLVIETRVKPHPRVRRSGLDLTIKLPVTLGEAYIGAEVTIPTFSNPVKLKIPPASQSGSRLRLRNKGVTRGKKTGDLFIELEVRMPESADPELAEAITEHEREHPSNPRKDLEL